MPPQRRGMNRLDSETVLFANIQSCHIAVSVAENRHDPEEDGTGPEVYMHLRRPDNSRLSIRLSGMTEEELKAFGTAMIEAVRIAQPVVRQRDKEAKEVEERGEVIRFRSYRSDPKITRVEGTKLRTYLESLHD